MLQITNLHANVGGANETRPTLKSLTFVLALLIATPVQAQSGPVMLPPSVNLIVEVDGDTHDEANDRIRDDKLAEFGFCVLRVTNADVLHNMEGVLVLIAQALREAERPHPNPSPKGEGLKEAQKLLEISLAGSVG